MRSFIQIPSSVPPDNGSPTNIDIPPTAALPMWAILAFMVFRELGLGGLLKSAQEGRQKDRAFDDSLTEKVVTQLLEQHGEMTAALTKLGDKLETLTEQSAQSEKAICNAVKIALERDRLGAIAARVTSSGQPS